MAIDIRYSLEHDEFSSGPFIDFSGQVRAYECNFDPEYYLTTIAFMERGTGTRVYRDSIMRIYVCSFDINLDSSHFRNVQSDITFEYIRKYVIGGLP